MTGIVTSVPWSVTLEVSDLARSARWYHETLGFKEVRERPGPNGLPTAVHLRRGSCQEIVLVARMAHQSRPSAARGVGVSLNFTVPEPIDPLVAQAVRGGAQVLVGPTDRPGRVREATIIDPDGYAIVLSGRRMLGSRG